ncbi:hypothetical protein OHA72_24825 [Dactylosporangium sp. NBC_01737]|uniref:hypothetical protein n=1 Tax=Dactylosporangium sp. NBC_01737 TaxID=2975959 RepID=UPI002E100B3F|nr:hypothetical protein OHA72_24825 [Dactylosporangium sp. NBC_01737]
MPWLEPLTTMLAYGVAGAVLIDRRPDLPFGWLLAGAAVLLAVHVTAVLPAYEAALRGDDGPLVRAGLAASSPGFLPIAVQGLVNVRFPARRPATRRGRVLELALITGTALVVLCGAVDAAVSASVDGSSAAGAVMAVLAPQVPHRTQAIVRAREAGLGRAPS